MPESIPEEPFEEYRRILRQIEALRPNLERFQDAMRIQASYTNELQRALERVTEPSRRLSEGLTATIQQMVGPMGAMQETLARVQDLYRSPVIGISVALERDLRQYRELGQLLASAMAPALSRPELAFDTAAVGDALARRLSALAESPEALTFGEVTEAAEKSLAEAAPHAVASPLVWQILLQILLQVLLTWAVPNPEVAQLENRLDSMEDTIEASKRELSAQIRHFAWKTTPVTHVTTRDLVLRVEPDSSARPIRRVPANSAVTVLAVDGGWYLVFDRDRDAPPASLGWLYGRYLTQIDAENASVQQ